MPATIITDRVLVTDHSHWDVMLRPQELIDGGVTDVILKAGSGLGQLTHVFRRMGSKWRNIPNISACMLIGGMIPS